MENVIRAIEEMKEYHESTCSDKYADSDMDTMNLIMSDNHGKSINIFNAYKYLSRYSTSGYDKSERRIDVIKAIHYLLFELARTEEPQTETTTFIPEGGSWTFTPNSQIPCVSCSGTGSLFHLSSSAGYEKCIICNGTGFIALISLVDSTNNYVAGCDPISENE